MSKLSDNINIIYNDEIIMILTYHLDDDKKEDDFFFVNAFYLKI